MSPSGSSSTSTTGRSRGPLGCPNHLRRQFPGHDLEWLQVGMEVLALNEVNRFVVLEELHQSSVGLEDRLKAL
eukprot:1630468-Alexandrium_andersonii.AAC.1